MTLAAHAKKNMNNTSRPKNTLDLSSRHYDTQTWINHAVCVHKIKKKSTPDSFFSNVLDLKYVVCSIPDFASKKNTIKAFQ